MATGTATVARTELFNVAEDAFYGFKSTRKEPERQRMLAAADALTAYLDSTGTPQSADEGKLIEAVWKAAVVRTSLAAASPTRTTDQRHTAFIRRRHHRHRATAAADRLD